MDATSSSLPLDAEGDRWSVLLEEGVRVVRLRHLVERLDADFDVDAGGHRQLRAINDPFELAVVSDLVARSAGGVAENLLEARVAQRDAEALMPAGGSKLTRRSSGREHVLRNARLDMAIGTLTACLSSAFDCIAACAIVVMRIAKPIKRAQLSQFADVNITPPTSLGIERLADWRTLLDFHRHGPPTGWFDWLSGMRNLRVHRARQNRMGVAPLPGFDSLGLD